MLFDLRSRGRKRAVRVTYSLIALLFLFGFIFVGVGTGLNGNLNFFEAIGGKGGGGNFTAAVEKARKRTHKEPQSASAWAALVQAELHEAGESKYTDEATGGYTPAGRKLLPAIRSAWERYLTVEPKNPSAELAKRMMVVLGEGGLDEAKGAVAALQIAIASEPNNDTLYADLAEYAYQAGNAREGDLASEKAIALAPASERAHLKGVLAALKKNGGRTSAAGTASSSEGG
jgi:cytochrome c-type biogenesis protein CcmH/NrfG